MEGLGTYHFAIVPGELFTREAMKSFGDFWEMYLSWFKDSAINPKKN